jgi:hypothetical protein
MENLQTIRLRKPIGVYILTICLFLRFGVFQFISDFDLLSETGRQTPLLIAFILIGRNVFVGGTSIWAFCGENWGRISLLAIVSLNVIWTIFNMITFVSFDESEPGFAFIVNNLFNPVFWLVICWWYLTKENVVKYYKQNDSN